MEPLIGAVGAVLAVLAAARVHRIASWRSVARIGAATGSLKACVDFIRFCERL